MKIVITGSLGRIGKPLTENLLKGGHDVTVISSKDERKKAIEAIGAKAAIGHLEDVAFLTKTFTGADAVFTLVPPANYFDPTVDVVSYYRQQGEIFAEAIRGSGVKAVVNLSSIGADLSEGNGILRGTYDVEQSLKALPADVAITEVRPVSIYYNLYGFMSTIKSQGMIFTNYGEDKGPWVSPLDIAEVAAEALTTPPKGRTVRYVVSEELTGQEIASILGKAIGKPDVKWVVVSDDDYRKALVGVGMNSEAAAGLAEMQNAIRSGKLLEDYNKQKPAEMGRVKMTDFAKEFAAAYNK